MERKIEKVQYKINYASTWGFYTRWGYRLGAFGVVRKGREFIAFHLLTGDENPTRFTTLYPALMAIYRANQRLERGTHG